VGEKRAKSGEEKTRPTMTTLYQQSTTFKYRIGSGSSVWSVKERADMFHSHSRSMRKGEPTPLF